MKHILYIASFYSPKMMKRVIDESKGKIMFASHNFELSLLKGFSQQKEISVTCLVAPGVGSYPHNNKKFYNVNERYEQNGIIINSIGFVNLFILNKIHLIFNLAFHIVKDVVKNKNTQTEVVISTATIYLQIAYRIAHFFLRNKMKVTTIVNDVPVVMDNMVTHKSFKMKIRFIIDKYGMKLLNKGDRFVLMTEETMDFIKKGKPHIVMEGIIDVDRIADVDEIDLSNGHEIITYAGSLNPQYGVLNLIYAFNQMTYKDAELWICGKGEAVDEIERLSKSDGRIKFWGLVNTDLALELQKKSSILVNPRTSEGEYTKYSFPSKTIEYLLSGRSVVINKLPCIPDEYMDYVYCPKDESVNALSKCLDDICNLDLKERNKKAAKARTFIMREKNCKVQVSRILELINNYA